MLAIVIYNSCALENGGIFNMNFLLFLGPIIGVSVSIIATVVIVSVIGAVAGTEEDAED